MEASGFGKQCVEVAANWRQIAIALTDQRSKREMACY
jgi:hypothetical protein